MARLMGFPSQYNLFLILAIAVSLQILAPESNASHTKSVKWQKARRLVSVQISATAVTLQHRSAVQMEQSTLLNAISRSSPVWPRRAEDWW